MQQKDQCLIESSIVCLPGCRDRSGSPLLFINTIDGTTQSGAEAVAAPSYEELVSAISYLSQIPDENARKLGFTVVIDGRKALLKHVRNALRACQQALYRRIRLVLIVQPEKFLDQQKLNFELIKEAYQFKSTLTSVHKLSRFVDVTQLLDTLGGTLNYNPHSWVLLRQKFENYVAKANNWIQSCKRREKVTTGESNENSDGLNANELLKMGDNLLDELAQNSGKTAAVKSTGNADWNNATQHVELLMKQIKDIEDGPAAQVRRAEQSASLKLLEEHAEGVRNLVDWIFGAGEKWLLTLHEIGESYDDAKQLLKEHNELESKSKEVEEQSRDLSTVRRELQREFPGHAASLQQSTDRLQQVTRAFCARVAHQKEVALRSVNFYRMLTDFSRKTDLLLESLCTDVKATDIASAETERNEMEAKVDEMEKIYHGVVASGVSFIDELCIDESNSMGRPVTRDYSAGIVHIRERLEETRDRRRRCQSLADVRRLKIQQLLQLYTCEKDGQQAVLWIEELYETLVNEYDEVGYSAEQLRILREDRLKLEETARSTYEYGKQLCQVALVLRRSLRMEVQPGLRLNQRLESVWGRLCHALSEHEAKLGITDAFHSTIRKVNERLDELSRRLNDKALERSLEGTSLQCLSNEKKSIANDVRELKHIADILVHDLNNKPSRNKDGTEAERARAVSEIQQKFGEVRRKQQKLEGIWEDEEYGDKTEVSPGSSARLVTEIAATGSAAASAGCSSALSSSTSPHSGDYILPLEDPIS